MEIEHFFTCPYCWQQISFVLDVSAAGQTYIEDCEVCCQPIKVRYTVEDLEIAEFEADSIEQ
jgi:transcription elongation factor Elf1